MYADLWVNGFQLRYSKTLVIFMRQSYLFIQKSKIVTKYNYNLLLINFRIFKIVAGKFLLLCKYIQVYEYNRTLYTIVWLVNEQYYFSMQMLLFQRKYFMIIFGGMGL